MNQPIFLWLSVLAASAAPLNTYAHINSKRSLSIDDSKRFVLTDAKYAKALGSQHLLFHEATNTQDKSFGLALSTAKCESLNTFATFERQEQKDQAFRKRARLSSGIGIGLPSDPSLTRDPIVDAAINEVKEENIKATV
jgi:hypothetical protein